MKHTNLIRLGGLASMVGGLAATTLGLLYVLQSRGVSFESTEKALQKGNYEVPASTVLLVGVLAATASLHIIQRGRYGRLGMLAFIAAFVGLVLIPGGYAMPSAAVAIPLIIAGILAASVGIVGLGIATSAAGVLPWWCGAALIAGSPPGVVTLFIFSTPLVMARTLPGEIGWILAGIPWVVVGYAVLRAEARQSARPARVL
jgi:hypothetical protein